MPPERADTDEWGRDPSVQKMRRVFAGMEEALNHVLEKVSLSPFDPRLRFIKEAALDLFEQVYPLASSRLSPINEELFKDVYLQCVKKAFSTAGIDVPAGTFPKDREMEFLLEEVSST